MAQAMHQVLRLWVKPVFREPLVERASLTLEAERGVVGDACYDKHRHVTIVFQDDWTEAEHDLGRAVNPVGRRANVLVSGNGGLRLVGQRIRLGACLIEIRGETKPCQRMEDAAPGLMVALQSGGRAGIWGRVLEGGTVSVGDLLVAD